MASTTARGAITSNTTVLSGAIIAEGVAYVPGDKVLVARENPSADSGLYTVVDDGPWTRHPDFATESAFQPMLLVVGILEGDHRRRNFQFKNPVVPAQLNLTLLNFRPVDLAEAPKSTGTITVDPLEATVEQADMGVTPGTYPNLTATITAEGNVVGAYGTGSGSSFIEGLEVIWNSATSITVKPGAAAIEGTGRVAELSAEKVFSGLSLTADTWYYAYLFEPTPGTVDVELVTTAPAAPYRGEARSKSGDTSRRYLRAIRAGAGGAIRRFEVKPGGLIRYLEDITVAPHLVLSDGRSSTYATVSCSAIVPPTSTAALARIKHETTNELRLSIPALSIPLDFMHGVNSAGQRLDKNTILALDGSQQFSYAYPGGSPNATNGLFVSVLGFWEAR